MSKIILFLLIALLPACGSFDNHWSVDVLDNGNSYIITSDLYNTLQKAVNELCNKAGRCPDITGGHSKLHFVSQVPTKDGRVALGNTYPVHNLDEH
jgi:hypothetical protein